MQLSRDLIQRMIGTTSATSVTGGGTVIDPYVLPVAADGTLGGVQLGYTQTGRNYPVQLDGEKAYVNVPWTDHYAWGDITNKPSAAGDGTTPVYWTGSGFAQCTSYANARVAHADNAAAGDIPFMLNGATDNLPRICWHIPNTNWCNLAMDSGGSLHLTETNAKSSTYHALYVGALQAYGNITVGNTTLYAEGSNGGINSLAVADDCILGDCNIGGHLGLKSLNTNNAGISFYNSSGSQVGQLSAYNGNVGIGTDSPSYKLHVAGKIYCTGGFAFLSDIRKKNVVGFCNGFSVKDIANAPLIQYTLKGDLDDGRRHIGSVAQYWQKVLPDTVNEADDTLSMDQESILMASVITLARKVMSMENQIIKLKARLWQTVTE